MIEPPGGGVGLSAVSAAAQATLVQRVQLLGDEGTRIVGVSADHLSVHMLRPYTNWEDFRPRILSAVDAYKKIARPEGINRFGLRYVNRITIDTETPDLGLYFSEPPIFPVFKHPARMTGFLERKEATFSDKPIRAVVTFADTGVKPAKHRELSSGCGRTLDVDRSPFPIDQDRQNAGRVEGSPTEMFLNPSSPMVHESYSMLYELLPSGSANASLIPVLKTDLISHSLVSVNATRDTHSALPAQPTVPVVRLNISGAIDDLLRVVASFTELASEASRQISLTPTPAMGVGNMDPWTEKKLRRIGLIEKKYRDGLDREQQRTGKT